MYKTVIVIESAEPFTLSQLSELVAGLRLLPHSTVSMHLNQTSHHDTFGETGYLTVPNAHADGGTADVSGLRKEL